MICVHRSLCLSLCIWVQVSEEARRGKQPDPLELAWLAVMSHLTWNSVLQELSPSLQPPARLFCSWVSRRRNWGTWRWKQLGCRCVTMALCDKQQQTHILGSSFLALSGFVPQLSFTFSLFSPSLPEFYSFSLTLIQPYRSPESHLTSPGRQLYFSNKVSG